MRTVPDRKNTRLSFPFFFQQEQTTEWPQAKGNKKTLLPRLFSFASSNAQCDVEREEKEEEGVR